MTLCRERRQPPPVRRSVRVRLFDPLDGRLLDHATAIFFESGASYTGEEAVEFTCHGGPRLLDRVVSACVDAGARPARPGEFTRRALAAGRLDLVQAEAVALLGEAPSDAALDLGLSALDGRTSRAVTALRTELIEILADLEVLLDHDEGDGIPFDPEGIGRRLDTADDMLATWLATERAHRSSISGFRAVLAGPPNAGKSSLFNRLLGQDRAIVHAEAGTTRDVVAEPIVLGGIIVALLDTAGLRDASGDVEAEGVARARESAVQSDLVILVIDGTDPAAARDALARFRRELPVQLVALNKSDLWDPSDSGRLPAGIPVDLPILGISARTGHGVQALLGEIASRAAIAAPATSDVPVIVGRRQVEAVEAARARVRSAANVIREPAAPLEVVAADVRASVEHLGELTGARVTEDILNRIFSRFCLGK